MAARAFRSWAPVLAWMTIVFVLSSRPVPRMVSLVPDWVGHGLLYLVLAVLLCRALAAGGPVGAGQAALAVLIATLYGATDEWHQSFVSSRHADARDVLKDLAGAACGALLSHLRSAGRVRPPLEELQP